MGTLYVVGIGPGAEDLVTPRARAALERADVVIGYTLYLDLLRAWLPHARLRPSPIGDEAARTADALRLAAEHDTVALVGSGDAGVYGLAGLAYELRASLDWRGSTAPAIEVIPGVTAATAAAALLGAPLGHDFAAISLSDLLTPWEMIECRVRAAAAADFITALYNPVSKQRNWQLPRVCDIFLEYRSPETPVGIVTDAARPGERITFASLATLPFEQVSMLSIVVIGNTATVKIDGRMVTPRGYRQGGGVAIPCHPVTVATITARSQVRGGRPLGRTMLAEVGCAGCANAFTYCSNCSDCCSNDHGLEWSSMVHWDTF